jgi:hypothetical protein
MAQNLQYGTYYSSPNATNNKMQRLIAVGIIVAVVLGGGLFALSLLNSNSKNDLVLLAVRENSLLTLTSATTTVGNIRDPDLATANSNATILLTSDIASLQKISGTKSLPGNLVSQEADTNGDTLKNADLLNKYDTTYRQIVAQKVQALISEAQELNSKLNKPSQTAVNQVIVNLQSIDKQFTQLQLQ